MEHLDILTLITCVLGIIAFIYIVHEVKSYKKCKRIEEEAIKKLADAGFQKGHTYKFVQKENPENIFIFCYDNVSVMPRLADMTNNKDNIPELFCHCASIMTGDICRSRERIEDFISLLNDYDCTDYNKED